MKRFAFLAALALTLAPLDASAQKASAGQPKLNVFPLGAIVTSGTTLAVERCVILTQEQTQGFGLLVVHIDGTFGNDGNFTMIVYAIPADVAQGTAPVLYQIQSTTVASGVGTSKDASWLKAVTAAGDEKWPWRVDVSGFAKIKVCFDHSAGDATDSFEATAHMATK
jgi:hypothetical protein